jgi:hypothetical protein
MMDMDVYANERLMVQRVAEERRLARRRRLQRDAGKTGQGRLLRQLGGLFVSVGQRLEQVGQVQEPRAQEQASGRA